MATINYADKVALDINPNVADINKVNAADMNLIKQVSNQTQKTLGVFTDDWSSSTTYNVGDIVIYDNRVFKNLTGTNTATTPDQDTTNWEETTIAAMAAGAASGDTLPIGSIVPYGNSTAPTNWLVCDGSAVSRTTYANLFAVIGTSYGAGDGSTTFNLPDLKGRVAVGQDTSDTDFDTMGETGGSKELQQHSHVMGNVAGYGSTSAWGFPTQQTTNMGSKSTDSAGTGNSGNLQPYQVVCYIIKANQSAGLVADISNTYSTSQTDAYSCDYINDCNTYSTSEVNTGNVWIDGKTIYRKVVNVGSLPNQNTTQTASGLVASNINIVKLYGTAVKSGTYETFPLPFVWGSTSGFTNYIGVFFGGTDNNSDIWVRTMADMSSYTGIIIIEYTKKN